MVLPHFSFWLKLKSLIINAMKETNQQTWGKNEYTMTFINIKILNKEYLQDLIFQSKAGGVYFFQLHWAQQYILKQRKWTTFSCVYFSPLLNYWSWFLQTCVTYFWTPCLYQSPHFWTEASGLHNQSQHLGVKEKKKKLVINHPTSLIKIRCYNEQKS